MSLLMHASLVLQWGPCCRSLSTALFAMDLSNTMHHLVAG